MEGEGRSNYSTNGLKGVAYGEKSYKSLKSIVPICKICEISAHSKDIALCVYV